MIKFDFSNSRIDLKKQKTKFKVLGREITWLKKVIKQHNYDDDSSSVNLVSDKSMLKEVERTIARKKRLGIKHLVVIGIGGSNLGTKAIQEAVLSKEYNLLHPNVNVYYADTCDPDSIHNVYQIMEKKLKGRQKVLLNVISKSGTTSETIANFEILYSLLKKYKKKDHHKYVVATTDKGSKLWDFAEGHNIDVLEIPHIVGGRFSVFSPVGLFPLGMLNVKIADLLTGAKNMRARCLNRALNKNPAAQSALVQYLHNHRHTRALKKDHVNVSDLFVFAKDLESMGKWYRQLMGESIGKEINIDGRKVYAGITPTVSVGSTDLHSMAQLYLGGPKDKITTFITINRWKGKHHISRSHEFDIIGPNLAGKSLQTVMDAISEGTMRAFEKNRRAFVHIDMTDKSEKTIGAFLQYKMIEMMFLGCLFRVNPYDQPAVDKYKKETRELLAPKTKKKVVKSKPRKRKIVMKKVAAAAAKKKTKKKVTVPKKTKKATKKKPAKKAKTTKKATKKKPAKRVAKKATKRVAKKTSKVTKKSTKKRTPRKKLTKAILQKVLEK